ncbi:Bis(5'-nucleosyl)-tetraphosphatase, symmetrical [Frankliniella fusca]|uniref:Bis(5'-nucleosyl)-tetraphosphatase, symmetrical n=1 Tax=Frankliniella fusca TaxID=407009 RepID=A0AAE1LMX6_9NEOP|nr:Bis(5'-nucleosyl)-tetraphosphatase, symmetrical [Frankliniella fusca]
MISLLLSVEVMKSCLDLKPTLFSDAAVTSFTHRSTAWQCRTVSIALKRCREPSTTSYNIQQHLLTCYIPVWFAIKNNSSIVDGSRHLFKAIETVRHCPVKVQKIVNPVIQTNSFFAHSENILLTMCFDGRQEAQDYTDMIDWSSTTIYSPPILRNIKNEEIQSLIDSGEMPQWDVTRFPCHTQAVERCVKLVTAASEKRVGFKSRHDFITSTLKSRDIMPAFKTKCQFAAIKLEKE